MCLKTILKMVFVHEENGGISIFVHEFRAALLSGAVTRSVASGMPKRGPGRRGKDSGV